MKKDEVIKAVQLAMENIQNFHRSDCLSWQGITDDTNEKIQEIITSEILRNLHKFDDIKSFPISTKYIQDRDDEITIIRSANDMENYLKRFIGLEFEKLGIIADYQIPLVESPNTNDDYLDFVAYNKSESKIYLIETYRSLETTLLQLLVTIYKKYKMIDHNKLKNELFPPYKFILNDKFSKMDTGEIKIIPVVLYQNGNEPEEVSFIEEDHKKLHALFLALDTLLYEYGFEIFSRLV